MEHRKVFYSEQADMEKKHDPRPYHKRPNFTHFLSAPLNIELFQHQFLQFKNAILADPAYANQILPQVFTNDKVLHLTLLMLPLESEDKLILAQKAFKEVEPLVK